MSIDDLLALIGFLMILAGIYLWLGLPAMLIAGGSVLVYAGWRLEPGGKREPDQTTISERT